MRRSIFSLLVFVAVISGDRLATFAQLHTEGGTFQQPALSRGQKTEYQPAAEYYDGSNEDVEGGRQRLAGIVEELNQQQLLQQQGYENEDVELVLPSKGRAEPVLRGTHPSADDVRKEAELEELAKFGQRFKELSEQQSAGISEDETTEQEPQETEEKKEKPLVAQKKGQSEFVEFVEPQHSKKLKNVEHLEKRLVESSHLRQFKPAVSLLSASGNIAFIAFISMCCVLSVVGVVGGTYYYNHVRSIREDPFDDFTRYSPAGPGRDKLKKGRGGANPAFGGEKGDDSLAYKAQLHHFQQTKQKIIGAEEGLGGHGAGCDVDASDKSDDEADLEHNFSVYECPGLAPTGDIEVQNPNFVDKSSKPVSSN